MGVNYMVASSPFRETTLDGVTLKISQKLDSEYQVGLQNSNALGVGAVVWDAGDLLLKFIATFPRLFTDKTLIDLGSGTGIVGIVAGWVGKSSTVWLTDHESLRTLNEENILSIGNTFRTHFNKTTNSPFIKFEHYWWGPNPLPEAITSSLTNPHFDIIVASDDLYDDKVFPPLLQTLKLITGDRTLVIFTYKRRMNEREITFFEQLEGEFALGVVDLNHFGCEPYTETYIILAGKKGGAVAKIIEEESQFRPL
ncbi:hypothetical protein TL16_g09318 [Triparma laevis f. inornata]|uniref:Uncharacterized protein n=1 Tax=Triparma laevis f. inornata TaxID=1714386 RepID=A0A9W7B2C9_9STRA|nr:hypothetical protein TL16_g09318 [Triparma laevis f. inornata]